jgi:hypothetical protein
MKGSHNFFANVKMTKNVERTPSHAKNWRIIHSIHKDIQENFTQYKYNISINV